MIDSPTDTPALLGLISTHDLAVLLVRHNGLHEGLYDLVVNFSISVGTFGLDPLTTPLPGVMTSMGGVGLNRVTKRNPQTVDAAEVNPAPGEGAREVEVAKSKVKAKVKAKAKPKA